MSPKDLPEFKPNEEAVERLVLTATPQDMAFELHKKAVDLYFREKNGSFPQIEA
ncbi:hypothetical protein ACFL9U_14860 [Thermodesulfobacteriota bacterium]